MDPKVKITQTQLFIDGKFVDAKSGKKFPTINPCTEEVIAEVWEAGKEDVHTYIKILFFILNINVINHKYVFIFVI